MELACTSVPADWQQAARDHFALPEAECLTGSNAGRSAVRVAFAGEGRLGALPLDAPGSVALCRAFAGDALGQPLAQGLWAGHLAPGAGDPDPVVCTWFNIGLNSIVDPVAAEGLTTADGIGRALQADTNCGSCRPELTVILARYAQLEVVE